MKIYWIGDSKNIIGPKLKQLRTELGLSQDKLASQLQLQGIEYNALTVLRIEKGERFVPDYEIVALAKFFNLTTDELLGITKADNYDTLETLYTF